MRCSLRDPSSKQVVHVLVPDRKSAQALGAMFPDSQVQKLALDLEETQQMLIGRPKVAKPKPKQQTMRESRQRNRAIEKETSRIEAGGVFDESLVKTFERECRADNKHLARLLEIIAKTP